MLKSMDQHARFLYWGKGQTEEDDPWERCEKHFAGGGGKENLGKDEDKIDHSGDMSLVIYPRRSGRWY